MKKTFVVIVLATLAISATAGTSDKIVLEQPLIVAATKDEAKNLAQMIDDGDKDGMAAEYKQGLLEVIKPGETVYVVNIGWDDVDTLRYHGQLCYAPNHEVHVIIYGNQ
jgi:hypothetical protein